MPVFYSANVGRKYGRGREVARNVRRVKRAHPWAGVGFQEIDEADPADEHKILARAFAGGEWAGFKSRVPLVAPRNWTIVAQNKVNAGRGVKGQSPRRIITEATLKHQQSKRLPPLVWLNTHNYRRVHRLDWRRLVFFLKLSRRIHYWQRNGYTVLLTLDGNTPRLPKLHRRQDVLHRAGIDYIAAYVHPEGAQLRVLERGVTNLTIDGHNAPYVRLDIDPPK